MKTNFKLSKTIEKSKDTSSTTPNENSNITPEEFEDFMIKSGAVGSFMIFRSYKKEDELGLEEL